MRETLDVMRKEFRGYFASPTACIFIGAFLAINLFLFFWVEAFFTRNIADVRPLFKWMPLLQVLLAAALTMRSWADELRSGTLETLLTALVRPLSLVLGKFLATEALIALALLLTLSLPVTVSMMGPVDWGPVIGGYVATLFLAAAHVSIGLFVSARSDNAIVALIVTTLICGALYLVGSDGLTGLFDRGVADLLASIGSGSRFESITRGVLDLRDLYYYLSIVGVFLTLNLFQLQRLYWADNPPLRGHVLSGAAVMLAAANFMAANLWLASVTTVRSDLTAGSRITLSETTRATLANLQEPLIIRGYFSSKTHPLLAPLVPERRDLLTEYAVAAGDRARVELLNPTTDPDAEESAASYEIRPVPFRTSDRHQRAVVSSYFDVLVSYGDQYQTLGYSDLIEVKEHSNGRIDVALKNPEYAITRAIRKVTQAYRAGGNIFAALPAPVTFHAYVSPAAQLPPDLRNVRAELEALLDEMKAKSDGKLEVSFEDPAAGDGVLADRLAEGFGLRPMITSLLDPKPFWFSLMFQGPDQTVSVALPDKLDRASLQRAVEAALRRLAPGFLHTVVLVKSSSPPPSPYMPPSGPQFQALERAMSENARVLEDDLKDGRVPESADLLMVLAPKDLDDKQRFAIDQFLMRGGSVVVTTSPFAVDLQSTLTATRQDSGLVDWLGAYGIRVEDKLVLDPRNTPLAVPVERIVGGLSLRDIRMMPYPHFPDLRGDALDPDSPVTAGLGQVTLNWPSPITVDAAKADGLQVTTLLASSPDSWTSDSLNVTPDFSAHPDSGFAVKGERATRTLAIAATGRFQSYYAGKPSPLLAPQSGPADKSEPVDDPKSEEKIESKASASAKNADAATPVTEVIERSPGTAHLVVVASNSFGSDIGVGLVSESLGTSYSKPLDFLQNVVDWSLEEEGLVALRGRTQFASTLDPQSQRAERLWEYLNYSFALLGLGLVWGWRRLAMRATRAHHARILSEVQL